MVLLESFMLIFAIAEPLATIPQIVQVWSGHSSAAGVSLITWIMYTLTSTIWLVYGIVKRDKPILFSGGFWALSEALVVLGIVFR